MTQMIDTEQAVRERYSRGAAVAESELCCPTSYDPRYLDVIPEEILEKDYGCGDPTAYVEPAQTVLDLGSGSGKACYILSQVVGPKGKIIGVDFNDDMLTLAEKHRHRIGQAIGWHNVEFRKGAIQNLRRNLAAVDRWLAQHPPRNSRDLNELENRARKQENEKPLIADESVDVVVSNCVLNLVRSDDKDRLFAEIYRVLRNGGRAVISDIVADEDVPPNLQRDPELWSGCISGALREDAFLQAFIHAGFHAVQILKWTQKPWKVVEGVEFRSVTVSACKGKVGPCWERNQAVMYKGPWSAVEDDDHHRFERGRRVAVCDKTFNLLRRGPYAPNLIFLDPPQPVPVADAAPFDCSRSPLRHPREMKDGNFRATEGDTSECCGSNGQCC